MLRSEKDALAEARSQETRIRLQRRRTSASRFVLQFVALQHCLDCIWRNINTVSELIAATPASKRPLEPVSSGQSINVRHTFSARSETTSNDCHAAHIGRALVNVRMEVG